MSDTHRSAGVGFQTKFEDPIAPETSSLYCLRWVYVKVRRWNGQDRNAASPVGGARDVPELRMVLMVCEGNIYA
jgi:hypothetical protein